MTKDVSKYKIDTKKILCQFWN